MRLKAFLVLVSLNSALSFASRGCQNHWVTHGTSRFCINDTPFRKWSYARKFCQDHGADLAMITSEDDSNFILDLIKKQNIAKENGVWLGLHRKTDGGVVYWVDDTPLVDEVEDPFEGQYLAWNTGQPDNHNGQENCVHMNGKGPKAGKWNDIPCEVKQLNRAPAALCEKKL